MIAGGLTLVALLVVLAVIGAYTFLPALVSERIAAGVRDDFGLQREPEVSVQSDPPLSILRGEFSSGTVEIGRAELFGFNVESVVVDLDPFDVDVRRSILERELVYEDQSSGTMTARVSSEEVGRVALEESGIENVSLDGGQLVVQRESRLFGNFTLPVEVRGDIELRSPELMVYTPRNVSVSGVEIPEDTADRILSDIELDFPIQDVGDGVTLTNADIRGDELVLGGDIEGM